MRRAPWWQRRFGCGACGRGYWPKPWLRIHQRFLCRGDPRKNPERDV